MPSIATHINPLALRAMKFIFSGVIKSAASVISPSFSVNVVEETLKRTNLGKLSVGSDVNLESALRVGDKIGGHNVQGHVDCTTTVKNINKIDNSWIVDFHKPEEFSHYFIEKGFITNFPSL